MNRQDDSLLPLLQWTADVSKPKHTLSPFTICPGDRILITGPSGSGKTSFFRRLVVLNTDYQDVIVFQGQKLLHSQVTAFRRACLWLPQHPPRTDEILSVWLKRRRIHPADAASIYSDFNIALSKLLHWSEGELDLYLRKKLSDFSGGELQAITLCAAVCLKPKILILDESTSAMDSELETRFWNWISESAQTENPELAILWTSHHPRSETVSQMGFKCAAIQKI